MSSIRKRSYTDTDIYGQLTAAWNFLRKIDDFYARAAAANNTTFDHYQVLLAVHCLGDNLPLRQLAAHLVRDRTATGQLCRRMEQNGLLELAYERDSHRPQLLVVLSERGLAVLKAITRDGLANRDQYLKSLAPDTRQYLAEAVRFSWVDGLEAPGGPARQKSITGFKTPTTDGNIS